MNLTLESDYALRIVYHLAYCGEMLDAARLSETVGVSLRFTLKILRKLRLAGLLRSFKGAGGGYALARPAETITMYDVIVAIEGDIPVSRCTAQGYECGHPDVRQGLPCPIRHIFIDLADTVRGQLNAVNFADLIKARTE